MTSGSALTSRIRRSSGETHRARGGVRARPSSAVASADAARLSGGGWGAADPRSGDSSSADWAPDDARPPGVPLSTFLVAVADAIQRFDLVEAVVDCAEFLADTLHVAVDGAVVNVDVFAVGGVDKLVATFHHSGPRRQRLDQQELGDGELDVLAAPGALVLGIVQHQLAAHHYAGGRGAGALGARDLVAAQQGAD